MKNPSEVPVTTNYDMFKKLKGNRNTDLNHVRHLVESMKEQYIPVPILVNSKGEIIDGQHRAAACRELGLPLYYIRGNGMGLEEVLRINSNTKSWSATDDTDSHIELGNTEYQVYKDFRERYQFSHGISMSLLNNGADIRNAAKLFRQGKFQVKNIKWAEDSAEKLYQIAPFYPSFKRRFFVATMCNLFKNKKYDHKHFIAKLKLNSGALMDCASTEQYSRLIERIYNFRSQDKINLF